jgi:hypothetical protein
LSDFTLSLLRLCFLTTGDIYTTFDPRGSKYKAKAGLVKVIKAHCYSPLKLQREGFDLRTPFDLPLLDFNEPTHRLVAPSWEV